MFVTKVFQTSVLSFKQMSLKSTKIIESNLIAVLSPVLLTKLEPTTETLPLL